jgi:DNA cross-link repair 1C protein
MTTRIDLSPVMLMRFSICDSKSLGREEQVQVRGYLAQLSTLGHNLSLDIDLPSLDDGNGTDIQKVIHAITTKWKTCRSEFSPNNGACEARALPDVIRFPYSRHSSYEELCNLIDAFKPADIWPCTVDPADWTQNGENPIELSQGSSDNLK